MSSVRSSKRTINLHLSSDALDWLDSMAREHSLPTQSKAARCCVNCAALTTMDLDDDVDEGGDGSSDSGGGGGGTQTMQSVDIELAAEQVDWLENRAGASANDVAGREKISVIMQRILHACRNAEKEEVFGVIRCKSKIATCEGAQDAVGILEKKYGECFKLHVSRVRKLLFLGFLALHACVLQFLCPALIYFFLSGRNYTMSSQE